MTATADAKTAYSFPVPDLSDGGLAKVTAQVAESAAEYDRTGEIPWKGLEAIHRAGLITASIAPEHGGPGITARDAARAVAAVGEGDPSVAIILANTLLTHGTIAAVPLSWYEPHYEDFLARSAQGIALANGLGAEPDLGASARGGLPATNLTRSGDGWVLNGRKGWGTGGTALTYHITHVVALEEGREPRVGFVTVPTDLPGVSVLETWDHIGLRASNTHDVVYENVILPLGAFAELPRQPDGTVLNAAARPLSPGTFAHTALYLGVARAMAALISGIWATTALSPFSTRRIEPKSKVSAVAICRSSSPATVWMRPVSAIGLPREVGTRSRVNSRNEARAARATPR